jgi:hypothetical protein
MTTGGHGRDCDHCKRLARFEYFTRHRMAGRYYTRQEAGELQADLDAHPGFPFKVYEEARS